VGHEEGNWNEGKYYRRVLTFKVGRFFKGGGSKGLFQPLGEGGQFTLNLCQFSCNFSLEGVQARIIGSNFRDQSLDVYLVLFGFILHVKEVLVVSGGHGWRRMEEGKWDHRKKSEK
jgi:hypothetical protein